MNQINSSSAKKPRLPRLKRAAPESLPRFRLKGRDKEIVKAVYTSRALTTAQIEALLFAPDAGQDHPTKK